ncbi:unnamed protein product [Durusdinium trenchii]|uniref:Uncharacterized protein n=1 Tax=Durusdinium trenchii TaxID=1381693 RepID=A0ABP0MU13_9DINO
MTIRVLMLVLAMGVAIEEFAESAVENDKECSLSLLQSTMQRSDGVRRTYLKTEGDEANQVDKVNDAVTPASLLTVDAAEASQKTEHSLLKSAFLKDVAQAILDNQVENRTMAREAARRRALG